MHGLETIACWPGMFTPKPDCSRTNLRVDWHPGINQYQNISQVSGCMSLHILWYIIWRVRKQDLIYRCGKVWDVFIAVGMTFDMGHVKDLSTRLCYEGWSHLWRLDNGDRVLMGRDQCLIIDQVLLRQSNHLYLCQWNERLKRCLFLITQSTWFTNICLLDCNNFMCINQKQ